MGKVNSVPIPIHQFGFAPDLPPDTPGVYLDMDNVYPTVKGFRALPDIVKHTTGLPAPFKGIYATVLTNGNLALVAATDTHLYYSVANIWVESDNSQTFTAAVDWSFTNIKDDVFATNGQDVPQISSNLANFTPLLSTRGPIVTTTLNAAGTGYAVNDTGGIIQNSSGGDATYKVLSTGGGGTVLTYSITAAGSGYKVETGDSTNDTIGTGTGFKVNITAISGQTDVPRGRFVVSIEPGGTAFFLMFLNISGNASGWSASGVGDVHDWAFSPATLGASGTLGATPGPITAAVPFRSGVLAFKANSFYFGQFVGTPFIWDFKVISQQQGVKSSTAIAQTGDSVAFIGNDDFYQFDGYSLRRIPNQLREWFIDNRDDLRLDKIHARYDDRRDVVFWYFPSKASSPEGTIDTWIAWHRKTDRWTKGTLEIEQALPITILEQLLGTQVGGVALPDGTFYIINGDPGACFVTTGDIGTPQRLTTVSRLKPRWSIYPSDHDICVTLDTYIKDIEGNGWDLKHTDIEPDTHAFLDFIQTARWNRMKLKFKDQDAEISGIDVNISDGGEV